VNVLATLGGGLLAIVGAGGLIGYGAYRRDIAAVEKAYAKVLADRAPSNRRFDPDQVAQMPEIGRRYFRHAVAPGTPLYSSAEIEMEGAFLLGEKEKLQTYEMWAREALHPPDELIWLPKMRSGAMTIVGSDALVRGGAWTRFWLLGLVPVTNARTSPDLVRSAQFRAAVEGALWLPTSLLPQNGAEWKQTGADQADVTFRRFTPPIVFRLTLDREGAVREVVGQRWSNVDRARRYQLQPFGGTMSSEATFQGLTIPTAIAVGNHYGTKAYLPFFQARITGAKYR